MTKKADTATSPFLQTATDLDRDIIELNRLARVLDECQVDSDKNLSRSQQFLNQFNEVRKRISTEMTALGRTLENARDQIEADTATAVGLADRVQRRHEDAIDLMEEFKRLGQKVAILTQSASDLKDSVQEAAKEGAPPGSAKGLGEMTSELDTLIAEANSLKEKATKAKMKTLESSADSLRQKLQSTNQRLTLFATNSSEEIRH